MNWLSADGCRLNEFPSSLARMCNILKIKHKDSIVKDSLLFEDTFVDYFVQCLVFLVFFSSSVCTQQWA